MTAVQSVYTKGNSLDYDTIVNEFWTRPVERARLAGLGARNPRKVRDQLMRYLKDGRINTIKCEVENGEVWLYKIEM